jgi:hypothetical protein
MSIKKTIHRTFLAAAVLASGLAIPQLVRADDTAARAAAASDPEYDAGYLSSWDGPQDANPLGVMPSAGAGPHEGSMKLQQADRAAAASDPEYGAGYLSSWGAPQDTNPADVTQSADARRHEEFVKLQQAARAAAASDPEYSAAADSGND